MKKTILVVMMLSILAAPFHVFAQDKLSVAVAANFISAFKEIAADFESKSGVKVEATFSSTGNLYSQIKNGAPYDVFLSADEQRPDLLQKEGGHYRRQPQWAVGRRQMFTPAKIRNVQLLLRSLYDAISRRDVETAVELIKLHIASTHEDMIAES